MLHKTHGMMTTVLFIMDLFVNMKVSPAMFVGMTLTGINVSLQMSTIILYVKRVPSVLYEV